MEWATIRTAFVKERHRRRLTQIAVATKGGLRQNAISKLESNDQLGPATEIVARAIEGLGMTVAAFFAQIEGGEQAGQQALDSQTPHRPGSANEPLPTPTPDDSQAAINYLAATALRLAERAAAADHRLPPGGAGDETERAHHRSRRVQKSVARTKARRRS
jgi:transcriptional regulator with XRE-family HTH domain